MHRVAFLMGRPLAQDLVTQGRFDILIKPTPLKRMQGYVDHLYGIHCPDLSTSAPPRGRPDPTPYPTLLISRDPNLAHQTPEGPEEETRANNAAYDHPTS